MIRKATLEDVPRICELAFMEYYEEHTYEMGLNFSYLTVDFAFRRLVNDDNIGTLVVAEEGDQLVGFYSSRYVPSSLDHSQFICTETGWFIKPEHRGNGLGKALLKETMKIAYEKGVTMKKVGAAIAIPQGKSLMDWYVKQGFVVFQGDAFKHIQPGDFEHKENPK